MKESKDSTKKVGRPKKEVEVKPTEIKKEPKKTSVNPQTTKKVGRPKKEETTKINSSNEIETKVVNSNMKNKIFNGILLLVTMLFIISMIALCVKYIKINQTKRELVNSVVPKSDKLSVSEELKSIKEKYSNDEIIALLNLDNYEYSIPIAKNKDNNYYLSHALDKSTSIIGSTFMDYRHNSDSKQINIYGHNSVRYEVPFKELEGYIKKDYYEKHKYFELKINNEKRIYEIFSVGVVEKSSKEEHMQFNYKTDDEWLNHFNRLKDKNLYDINVDVSGKDSILILQTCLFGRYSNKLLTISGKLIYAK